MMRSGSFGTSVQASAAATPSNAVAPSACRSARVSRVSATLRTTLGNITEVSGPVNVISARPIIAAGM